MENKPFENALSRILTMLAKISISLAASIGMIFLPMFFASVMANIIGAGPTVTVMFLFGWYIVAAAIVIEFVSDFINFVSNLEIDVNKSN